MPDLLARAVNRLEEVRMEGTKLTKQQVEEILTQSLVETSLKDLRIGLRGPKSKSDKSLVSIARNSIGLTVINGVPIFRGHFSSGKTYFAIS
jgi:hypothetical protein